MNKTQLIVDFSDGTTAIYAVEQLARIEPDRKIMFDQIEYDDM